tara:strand:+ start:1348 stop:2292 length:945 start_codon:yes stop_codon:yes gene_type:complete
VSPLKNKKVLITGSNGFLGKSLCKKLRSDGYNVFGSVRNKLSINSEKNSIYIKDLDINTNWKEALEGCEVVIHLAGRAHILNDKIANPLKEFRKINREGTLNLAKQAAASGVSRFIFISSIGVNGAVTLNTKLTPYDLPSPHSPYAISKFEAEQELKDLANKTGLELVIIRSPAIYGPDAPGNFGMLEKFIKLGIPLPVGKINNKRSLVAIENIVSFIEICINHKNAANEVLFVSDNYDLSTLDIVKIIGKIIGKKPRIMNLPIKFIWFIVNLLGKQKTGDSLMSDLQLDVSKSIDSLGWNPPFNPKTIIEDAN